MLAKNRQCRSGTVRPEMIYLSKAALIVIVRDVSHVLQSQVTHRLELLPQPE